MRSIDMLCPTTEEGNNTSTELEENTSAINKLIEKLEEKIVINPLEDDNDNEDDEESEDDSANE